MTVPAIASTSSGLPHGIRTNEEMEAEAMSYCYGNSRFLDKRPQPLGERKAVGQAERPVVCVEDGAYYPNARTADHQNGGPVSTDGKNVIKCCTGKSSRARGKRWRWASADEIRFYSGESDSEGVGEDGGGHENAV